MCPNGFRFWRNVRWRLLVDRTTAVANETFTTNRNPERVRFIVETDGGAVYPKLTEGAAGPFVYPYHPVAVNTPEDLTIERFGQLIFEQWTFIFQSFPNRYRIFELTTPPDFQ